MRTLAMKTLTITELPDGSFLLAGGSTDIINCNPEEGPVSACQRLGATYDYPNSTATLPGCVRAFFDKPTPIEE